MFDTISPDPTQKGTLLLPSVNIKCQMSFGIACTCHCCGLVGMGRIDMNCASKQEFSDMGIQSFTKWICSDVISKAISSQVL